MAASAAGIAPGALFAGKTFWVSRGTPSRSKYVESIESNGGARTEVENLADYKIADHLRTRLAPAGSVSFEFIDACLRAGAIVDYKPHLIFPEHHEPRSIGSVQRPAKGRRTPFTAADDRILAGWVNQHEGALHGNVIFQKLEAEHPNHTWQSWRDRYVKGRYAKDGAPAITSSGEGAPSPASNSRQSEVQGNRASALPAATETPAQSVPKPNVPSPEEVEVQNESLGGNESRRAQVDGSPSEPAMNGEDEGDDSETLRVEAPFPAISGVVEEDDEEAEEGEEEGEEDEEDGAADESASDADENKLRASFTVEDFQTLLSGGKSIVNIEPNRVEEAWSVYAQDDSLGRTGEQWQTYWEEEVLPVYLRQKTQRRMEGVPSPDVTSVEADSDEESNDEESNDEESHEEESYDEEISASKSASQNASGPLTPPPAEGEGIEILADDGKRHLSTPIRTRRSEVEKRKHVDKDEDSGSTSPIGKRSPLKKRRLDVDAPQPQAPSVIEDSETEDVSTQAQGAYHTAPSGNRDLHVGDTIDLSQLSDGDGTSESDGSAAFEDSARFETAQTERIYVEDDLESSKDDHSETADTQGHIDAQLISEMSSAVQQTSPPPTGQRKQSSSFHPTQSSIPIAVPQDAESSDSDSGSDLSAVIVTRRSPAVEFAPAAFQTSPQSTSRTAPALLPAFSSEPLSAKARGKQRRKSSPRNGNGDSPTPTQLVNELSAEDIPAWIRAHLSRGVPMAHLQTAVKAASGELGLAERVLRALERGQTVPANVPGIWTEADDVALRHGNETNLILLVKKHGRKLFEERSEFLRAFEESDDDDEEE